MSLAEIFSGLLHEDESSTLDFKRDQYPFFGASDGNKSELLKDILAFANAWRRVDAFILIGVDEVKGGRSEVVGIQQHLNDADLQQFVNSKVNRPITFSYASLEFDGKQVGVIQVPVQQRPFYLNKQYAGLAPHSVYLRRGSSTAIATPDEIADMRNDGVFSSQKSPILSAFIVSGKHGDCFDKKINLEVLNAKIPKQGEFPSYGVDANQSPFGFGSSVNFFGKNKDYYWEYAKYWMKLNRVKLLKFSVHNSGNAVARDVQLVLRIKPVPDGILVFHEDELPSQPQRENIFRPNFDLQNASRIRDIRIKHTSNEMTVSCSLGKIQACAQTVSTDFLCIGATSSIVFKVAVEIYSDDLEAPVSEQLDVSINVTNKTFGVSDFVPSS